MHDGMGRHNEMASVCRTRLRSAGYPVLMTALLCAGALPAFSAERKQDEARMSGLPVAFDTSVFLIRDEAVQAELQLNGTQREDVGKLMDEADVQLWALRDSTNREKSERWRELVIHMQRELSEILDPSRVARLNQIVRQAQGPRSLSERDVAGRLALTHKQQQQIGDVTDKTRWAMAEFGTLAQAGRTQDELDKLARHLRALQLKEVLAILNTRQQKQWQKLLGEPFDLSRIGPMAVRAPDFHVTGTWINSKPLTLDELRGRVVVVHFWTFACINCRRNYPHYKKWHDAYHDKGLTIVGIHTPEMDFDRNVNAIRAKAKENGLAFPILVDNDKKNWNTWTNHTWPSVYLIDKQGRVRSWWYGELNWDGVQGEQIMRQYIETLLADQPKTTTASSAQGSQERQATSSNK